MAATEQVTLNVDGMTCAGCQAHVQEALSGKAGVTQASVNLLMKRAAVTFDPSVISPEALVEAVRESGYEASLPDSSVDAIAEQEARDRAQEAEYRSLRLKAIASGAAALLTMLLSMPLMFDGELNLKDYKDEYKEELRKIIDARVAGEEYVAAEVEEAPTNVVDLMAALRKSLDAASASKKKPAKAEPKRKRAVG